MKPVEPVNAGVARKEMVLANFLPFSSHVTDNIVTTRAGHYMRVWRVGGLSFEAADEIDIETRHDAFNQTLRSINSGGTAIWSHKIRRRVGDRLDAKFPNKYCREFDQRYNDSFAGYRMMANELYMTVIYNPRHDAGKVTSFLGKITPRSRDEIAAEQKEAISALNEIAMQVEASMKDYDLEALGGYKRGKVLYSHILEFFGFLVNGFHEPVPLRRARINEYLPSSRLFVGNENIEIRGPTATRFAAVLDFADYPEFSEPGLLNPTLYEDFEYIETQSFSMMSKRDGIQALKDQRGQLLASEDISSEQVDELDFAMEEVVNGRFVMGEYHYSLAVLGDTIAAVQKNLAKARATLSDQGFQTKLVDLVPEAGWFAQLPGNWRYRPREAKITSRAFCGLSCYHNFATGKRDGNPWGQAVTIMKTPSGQPYYFNFHVTDEDVDVEDEKHNGNTMIIGQNGSGKTVVELMLVAQAMKYDPTAVVFDKDRGCEIAIRMMGGAYFPMQMGKPTGISVMKMTPTPKVILFWESLIKRLVTSNGQQVTPSEEAKIMEAVATVARMDVSLRSLRRVRENLPKTGDNSLHLRLSKWCQGENLGWVLDSNEHGIDLTNRKLYGFDCTDFLDAPEIRTPIMMTLMFMTEGMIDGRRFMYVMAEFWKPLADEYFMEFAKNKQKTIRKQNGFGIFDTQSPSDAIESPIARTLIEQCATFIFLANPLANKKDYIEHFNLSEAEFDIVRSLDVYSRTFLVKQGKRSALVKLDLGGFTEDLLVLSGTTDNVELLDEIRAEIGSDDPDDWFPILKARVAERRASSKRDKNQRLAMAA